MSREELIVRNSVSVNDATLDKKASILNGILATMDRKGIEVSILQDTEPKIYRILFDSSLFTNKRVHDGIIVIPKPNHPYTDIVDALYILDLNLFGTQISTDSYDAISHEARVFDTILSNMGKVPIHMRESKYYNGTVFDRVLNTYTFNGAYFTYNKGDIDLRDEYKQYVKMLTVPEPEPTNIIYNAKVSKNASMLHLLLVMDGKVGITMEEGGIPFRDTFYNYNAKYFHHTTSFDMDGIVTPVIMTLYGTEYDSEVKGLINIDFSLTGEIVEAPLEAEFTPELIKLSKLMIHDDKFQVKVEIENDRCLYNDAYYHYVDGVLDLKDEYKQYVKTKEI